MSGKRRLAKVFKDYDVQKQDRYPILPGRLGIISNGDKTVEISDRSGFVWVRLRGHTSELIQAFNDCVSPVYDLPVLVTRDEIDPRVYRIIGRDATVYNNWGSTAYLPKHAMQHTFPNEVMTGGGGDIVWVQSQQFYPLLAAPSGTYGSPSVVIEPYLYYSGNDWNYVSQTGSASFAAYKPTGTVTARMALLYLRKTTNTFGIVAGDEFDASLTGTSQIYTYIPDIPTDVDTPIVAVRLVTGTNSLSWSNLYETRPWFSSNNGIGVLNDEQILWGNSVGGIGQTAYLIYDDATESVKLTNSSGVDEDWLQPGRLDLKRKGTNPYVLGWYAHQSGTSTVEPQATGTLMRFSALGWYEGSFAGVSNARIDMNAANHWGNGDRSTYIEFQATPSGTLDAYPMARFYGEDAQFLKGVRASSAIIVTGTYYATAEDFMLMARCVDEDVYITLPSAASLGKIVFFKILEVNGHTVHLSGAGSDLIDGTSPHDLVDQYNRMILWADGDTNWYILCQQ